MNESLNLNIQLVLAKNFIGAGGKIPAAQGYRIVKEALRGSGVRKSDVAKARRKLGIRPEKLDGEYWWIWENEQEPEAEWERLSEEFWRQINARKGD